MGRVKQLLEQAPAEEIAVVAKFKNRVNGYAGFLREAGIETAVLDADGAGAGVRLAPLIPRFSLRG